MGYERKRSTPESLQFGVFHVRENEKETYFASVGNHELLHTADQLRHYVQHEETASAFENLYPNRVEITEHEFDRYARKRLENSGGVTGAFHIDFNNDLFSGLHIMDGWQSFQIKDICSAVNHAMRKRDATVGEQRDRLFDRLHGKEITPDSEFEFLKGDCSLRPEDISFSGEIDQNDNLLDFYL